MFVEIKQHEKPLVLNIDKIEAIFHEGVQEIRQYETFLSSQSKEFFEENHQVVIEKVNEIVGSGK